MRSLSISVCLPPRELSPNARCHWAARARAAARCRFVAKLCARRACEGELPPCWKEAVAETRWFFRIRRRRDRDNLIASLKPVFDGLADAGIIEDDAGLHHESPVTDRDVRNPRVEVTIRPVEADGQGIATNTPDNAVPVACEKQGEQT